MFFQHSLHVNRTCCFSAADDYDLDLLSCSTQLADVPRARPLQASCVWPVGGERPAEHYLLPLQVAANNSLKLILKAPLEDDLWHFSCPPWGCAGRGHACWGSPLGVCTPLHANGAEEPSSSRAGAARCSCSSFTVL